MTTVDLSRRNAHRVATVRSKTNPELGEIPFNYYAKTDGSWRWHTVGSGEREQVVILDNLKNYEVASFRSEPLLDEFWEACGRSYQWSSMDADKRQEQEIKGHEEELAEDLAEMPEEYRESYITGYKKHFSNMISARSRTASTNVTGPAKFNHERNNKAVDSYMKRIQEFSDWRKRTLARIAKTIANNRPVEEKIAESWAVLKEMIDDKADSIRNGGYRSLFVSNLYSRLETVARHGHVELIEKSIEYIRELNKEGKPIITERHKLFQLPEIARKIRGKNGTPTKNGNKEFTFEGGIVVWNYEIERIQIIFDEKPDKEMCTRLGREFRFNYSRTNNAWQRQITRNTEIAVQQALNIKF